MSKIGKDHNGETQDELLRKQQFFKLFGELQNKNSDAAGIKGEINGIYQRAKAFKISKGAFKFALTLQDKDTSEVIADLEEKLWVARNMGHSVGRQFNLFEDKTPQDERAYQEGHAVGAMGGENKNPYDAGSPEGQAWQKGMNEGNTFRNETFKAAIDETELGADDENEEVDEADADDAEGDGVDPEDEFDAAAPDKKDAAEEEASKK